MIPREILSRSTDNRRNGILKDLHRRRRFIELHGIDRAGACLVRNNHYDEKRVVSTNSGRNKKTPEEYMDAFDLYSRFFFLRGDHRPSPKYLLLKIINRQIYGLVPTELSLYDRVELVNTNRTKNLGIDESKLSDSTMTQESRDKLTELIKKFNNSQTVYEVGGLCGSDQTRLGTIGLIYLIARIANIEKWDFEIQTCHPKHVPIYLASGLPYRTINPTTASGRKISPEPYLDYLGRPAVTLYLDGEELRERFPSLEMKLLNNS